MVLSTVEWVIIFCLIGFALIVSGIIAFYIFYRMRWNYTFTVFENVAGSGYVPIRSGRCRLIGFGDGGEEIFMLNKPKKWRVAYGKRIGRNKIAWAIGEDGYWYNFTFGNLDKRLTEMGVNPVDRDMRYAYASVRKGIDSRYDRKSFMDKYGTIISFGMLFLCILAMAGFLWVLFNQQAKIAQINNEGLQTAKQVMELAKQVLSNIDTIKSGGSGLVPVA